MFKSAANFKIISILVLLFTLFSCKSTKVNDYDVVYTTSPLTAEKSKFLFIRLYDPIYKNPFYIANLLKFGINSVEVSPLRLSHASIGFSLDDDFYGLTNGGERYDLKIEHCVDYETNGYMKKCNPKKSRQVTYAIAVSEEEYNETKKLIDLLMDRELDVKYVPGQVFPIAGFGIRRRYFTEKENRGLEYSETPKGYTICDINYENKEVIKKFICSNMVAFVLQTTVKDIQDYFVAFDINYEYINVTDIIKFPGVEKLFESNWCDYDIAAADFVSSHKEFENYKNNQN